MFGLGQGVRVWLRSLPWVSIRERTMLILLAGLVTGAMYPLNTWDYPTYLLVAAGAIFILDALGSAIAALETDGLSWRVSFAVLRRAAISTIAVLVVGRLLFLPYFAHYQTPNSGFDPWLDRSPADQYLVIHGFFLFIIGSYVLADLLGNPRAQRTRFACRPASGSDRL